MLIELLINFELNYIILYTGILQTLPWSLKLVFGFVSDAYPIGGAHRKPYLTFGALLYSLSFIYYGLSNVSDIVLLACCICVGTIGLIQMDVMTDTMLVERSKFEKEVVEMEDS